MRKRFSQNETGLYTSAEAIAFIGCAVKENLMKEEEWAYSALIFIKNEPRIVEESEEEEENSEEI